MLRQRERLHRFGVLAICLDNRSAVYRVDSHGRGTELHKLAACNVHKYCRAIILRAIILRAELYESGNLGA